MSSADREIYSRNTFLFFFAVIVILVFFMVKPFLNAIIAGILLAYIFFPLHEALRKTITHQTICALITSLLLILIITLPFYFLVSTVSHEAARSFSMVRQKLSQAAVSNVECANPDDFSCLLSGRVTQTLSDPSLRKYLQTSITKATTVFLESTSKILVSIPKIVLNLFIMLFVMVYAFRDGKRMIYQFFNLLPLKRHFKNDLFHQTTNVLYATVYGSLIVAILQGLLAMIGFALFGIPSPILLGLLVALIALIPVLGPAIIWVPITTYTILQGYFTGDMGLLGKGIAFGIYCAIFLSGIDNVLKPKLIGARSQLHPALILLGIFGGLSFFGFIGILVGPVLMALFVSFIKVFERDKEELFDHQV